MWKFGLWWAPLVAAILHITEEFVVPGGFADWDRAYRPEIRSSITWQLHVVVNLGLLVLCVMVGLAGYGDTGAAVGRIRLRSLVPAAWAGASWIALAALLFSNAVFHLVGTIRSGRYWGRHRYPFLRAARPVGRLALRPRRHAPLDGARRGGRGRVLPPVGSHRSQDASTEATPDNNGVK
jgi:hypothetical protein